MVMSRRAPARAVDLARPAEVPIPPPDSQSEKGSRPKKRRKLSPATLPDSVETAPAAAVEGSGGKVDEFQQVTLPAFVERYKIQEMAPSGDVYYQGDVGVLLASLFTVRRYRQGAEMASLCSMTSGVHKPVYTDSDGE